MGAVVFLWILFIAWLMWSSKDAKETFLFYALATILGAGILNFIYEGVRRFLW